jgi:hypothetical protein
MTENTKRNRRENVDGHAVAIFTIEVTEIERVFLSWLIGQIQGLDRDGSRKVARIIDVFDLENFDGIEAEHRYDAQAYELSGYEIHFLLDELDRLYKERKILPAHAKPSISLYDKLKIALDTQTLEAENSLKNF